MTARKPSVALVSNEVLSEQVRGVSSRIDGIDTTLRAVAESLTAFVRLEERHAALIKQVETLVDTMASHYREDDRLHEAIDTRIGKIERDIPGLKEVRRWVITALLGLASLVGIGVYNGVMTTRQEQRANNAPPAYYTQPAPAVKPATDQ